MQNAAIVSPNLTPVSSPSIDDSEAQRTLHLGPTGVVHRGGVPWAKRCALTKTPSPSSKLVFMVLASFVNGPDEAAWPSQSTLAAMTGLTARGVRNATKQLEAAGRIRVDQGGGDKSIRYWLTPEVSSPLPRNSLPPPPEVSSPEVRTSEGTNDKAAAAPLVNVSDRYTCSCGNNWPKSRGDICYQCRKSARPGGRLQAEYAARLRSAHPGSGAVPTPGKYDDLFETESNRSIDRSHYRRR